ncbi:MAG: NUDIX hydrolase [Steroidobacteraceae bacterium]
MADDSSPRAPAATEPRWLELSRELTAIAQAGLAYSRDPFDLERFSRLREIAAELAALQSAAARETILDLFAAESGYPTPKVDVRGGVFRDGRILLVREKGDGCWALPGGWADVNQTPSECVEREIAEESGYRARAIKLAAVWDYRKRNAAVRRHAAMYKLFFLCEFLGGSPAPSLETEAAEFFAAGELPELSVGRSTRWQIQRLFEHFRHPALPTEFD